MAVGRTDPTATIAAVIAQVAEARGIDVRLELAGQFVAPAAEVMAVDADDVAAGPWGPWLPGFVREALTAADERHDQGVHHTPPEVVAEVLDLALAHAAPLTRSTTVLDPAVGGGAFLLAMAERLAGEPDEIVGRLHGVDVDPLAVATTRAALTLWSGAPVDDTVRVGDSLTADPFAGRRFDLVVGNPPFLSQLRGGTTRDDAARAEMAARWPGVGGYVDDAAAFLLAGLDAASDDGTVVMIQPASVLGASDAEPVRARLADAAPPVAMWVDPGRAFAAGVDTVALVHRRDSTDSSVEVGSLSVDRPPARSWAPLLAAAAGVPVVPRLGDGRTLGDVARVTAGFRDQYYGLADAVVEDASGAHPLITSGAIDPLHDGWGSRPSRYAKQPFDAPSVVLDRIDPKVARWFADRLVPKVLVASQTQVIEAIVDAEGVRLPCTPVVSIEPTAEISVWEIAALLTSPVATAWLVTEAAGTALSASAVRVSASTLAAISLPTNAAAWARATSAAESGDVEACGRAMLDAHEVGDGGGLFSWWFDRIPTRSLGI